jgi:hypothetical protein
MKAFARLVGPLPGQDHPIELHNLLLEAEQLSAERGKARAGNLWHPFVVRVGNNMQQFRDPFTPDRRAVARSASWAQFSAFSRKWSDCFIASSVARDIGGREVFTTERLVTLAPR